MQQIVGVDIGKRLCHVAVSDGEGDPQSHRLPREAVAGWITAHVPGPAMIVFEFTGGLEQPLLDGLHGDPAYTLMVAQTTDSAALRQMLRLRKKTDRLDAILICKLARLLTNPDTAPLIAAHLTPYEHFHPTRAGRDDVRILQQLVRQRAAVKTRGQYARGGEGSMEVRHTAEQREMLDRQIQEATAAVIAGAGEPERLLASIPMISIRRACILTSAIGSIERFKSPDNLVSYVGLVPPHRPQSGTREFKAVRHRHSLALLEGELHMFALGVAQRPHICKGLGATYERVKARQDGRVAMWAVRRQLIRTCWGVLKSGEPYRG